MRRFQRQSPQPLFRGSEMLRLMGSITMLGIVAMLILHFRDPANVRGLVGNDTSGSEAASHETDTAHRAAAASGEVASPPALAGPTDQDAAEVSAIQEEFQAVTDGTTAIQLEEQPAYDRLVRWAAHQPVQRMLPRARRDLVFTQFMQAPDKWRGQLVSLELNVRRILKYDEPGFGGVPLYEVWGWTTESKLWLYVGVVTDLPQGMPIGPDVSERATLVGYFLKLQGYLPAKAKQGDPPQRAPLFIGRLVWHRASTVSPPSTDWFWGTTIVVILVSIAVTRLIYGMIRARMRHSAVQSRSASAPGTMPIEEWLERAEAGPDPLDADHGGEDNQIG